MTKRLLPILLLLAAILLTLPAMAASTEEEWNASCNWVISHNTTLYTASYVEDAATNTDLYKFTPIGTISAGSKVSIRSSATGMREIYYWNGGKRSAWVLESAVRWDGGSSTGSGSTGSGSSGSGSSGSGSSGSVSTNTNLGSGSSGGRYYPKRIQSSKVWEDLDVTLLLEDDETTSVSLEVLGTAQSIVFDGEEMMTVPTEKLQWETEAEDDQRLGIINAPKTGKATLRASASSSAKKLDDCEDGRIVAVLKVGKTWTRIMYDGKEGCVLTAAIKLCGAVPEEEITTATLSYKGRTDSSATISVYTATNGKRRIDQWRVGNEVVILGETGSWTEVEIEGWHGFVKSAYLE